MATDQDFDVAHTHVAAWEGGLSNDKDDAGGLTRYGVSLEFLKSLGEKGDLNHDGIVDAQDVMSVTKDVARALFRAEFWESPRIAELPSIMAIATYDAAVNTGAKQAVKFLQRALRKVYAMDIAVDGIIGRQTIAMALMANESYVSLTVTMEAIAQRERFYDSLVARNPRQKKFLRGWLNRCAALRSRVQSSAAQNSPQIDA